MSNDRIDRLPKWAREEIERLRRAKVLLQDQLADGVCGVNHAPTSLHVEDPRNDRGGHMPSRFRDGRFMLGGRWNDFIDFRMDVPNSERDDERRVYVHSGTAALIVEPRAANAIFLRVSE